MSRNGASAASGPYAGTKITVMKTRVFLSVLRCSHLTPVVCAVALATTGWSSARFADQGSGRMDIGGPVRGIETGGLTNRHTLYGRHPAPSSP